jgi:hypothetical protein
MVLEEFATKHNASYRVVLGPESQALTPYAEWSGVPVSGLGYDLENARTIVSFGAPLLDGWGTPGRFARLWSVQAAGAPDPQLRLIQIEPTLSHTAARAWRWIAIPEGTDGALAAGMAHVLIEEHLVPAKGPLPATTLENAATATGLTAGFIHSLVHTIVAQLPAVVITATANPCVAALNVLLGALGKPGGIVLKKKKAVSHTTLEESTNSYRAMLIDSTVPWDYVPRTNAEVFRFAAWDGDNHDADWLLPSPGFLEETTDIPAAPTSGLETYSVAVNLIAQREKTRSSAQFLTKIDSTLPAVEKLIHARCEEIFQVKLGTICAEQATPTTTFESAQRLEEQLRKGAVWVGEPLPAGPSHCALKAWPTATDTLAIADWASAWTLPVLPPLAAKLYQESNLREAPVRRQA